MSQKKNKAEIRADQEIKIANIYASAEKVKAISSAAWKVLGVGCVPLSLWILAGQETSVKAVLDAALKVDISQWAAILIAALNGVGWWRAERLRKKEVSELSKTAKEYEILIDPKRTSSMLTDAGTPAPQRLLSDGRRR